MEQQPLLDWEKESQPGISPVRYENGRYSIDGPTWTEQTVEY